jgi:ribosome biogenesis GTPase / thiamine phosphate phosphatase
MPEGRIIKALSGYYYVLSENEVWQCRARGVFKKRGITPLVGDWVSYDQERNQEGYVTQIHDRSTQLVRPPIANVDQAVLVFSLVEPAVSPSLLDKFLVHTESSGVKSIICLTKADLSGDNKGNEIAEVYRRLDYPVIITSKITQEGIPELKRILSGSVSVVAGQSGVGKSTLLNYVLGANLLTGYVSERLGRGRHTTRHVELLPFGDGFVADTPGFSQLDFFDIEPEKLSHYYVEMRKFLPSCKFRGCLHLGEPHCAVREALENGKIAPSRYHSYTQFVEEIKDKKRRY